METKENEPEVRISPDRVTFICDDKRKCQDIEEVMCAMIRVWEKGYGAVTIKIQNKGENSIIDELYKKERRGYGK